MSHRIWWLISFVALIIGAAVELDRTPNASPSVSAAEAAQTAPVAARASVPRGG